MLHSIPAIGITAQANFTRLFLLSRDPIVAQAWRPPATLNHQDILVTAAIAKSVSAMTFKFLSLLCIQLLDIRPAWVGKRLFV
jgi:hypothetical protein